jgi:hypothetical protein
MAVGGVVGQGLEQEGLLMLELELRKIMLYVASLLLHGTAKVCSPPHSKHSMRLSMAGVVLAFPSTSNPVI